MRRECWDEVVLSAGTYQERLSINKPLILRSADPTDSAVVRSTIVDGSHQATCPVIGLWNYYTDSSSSYRGLEGIIAGLTITGGTDGGVSVDANYLVTITNCEIRDKHKLSVMTIGPHLASVAEVNVSIRNLTGREVAVLQPGRLDAGVNSLLWSGKSTAGTKVPAGMYMVRVTARGSSGTVCSAIGSLRK